MNGYLINNNEYRYLNGSATSIRRTFKSSKNEKLFDASKEFHVSDYLDLVIFWGD